MEKESNEYGWVKLYRKITLKGYYNKSQYVHLWVHLLLKANHAPKEFMWNNQIILVKEGQFITGRKELSKQTGISETTIERILSLLESEHQIGQQKTTKYRLITIINWKDYQQADNRNLEKNDINSENSENRTHNRTTEIENNSNKYNGNSIYGKKSDSKTDNKRTTDGQQADTNKNDKNEKNEKNLLLNTDENKIVDNSVKNGTGLEQYCLLSWGKRLGHIEHTTLIDLGNKHGWDKLYEAIDTSCLYNAKSVAYVKGILEPKEKKSIEDQKWEEHIAKLKAKEQK